MFQALDNWLFDAKYGFQNIQNRWQRLTGLTCFWLARFFSAIFAAGYGIGAIIGAIGLDFVGRGFAIVSMLLVTTWNLSYISFLKKEEKKYLYGDKAGVMNKRRIETTCVNLRTVLLFFVTLSSAFALHAGSAWSLAFAVGYAAALLLVYFASCTPLPPQKSTMRKWWERIFAVLNEKPELMPVSDSKP